MGVTIGRAMTPLREDFLRWWAQGVTTVNDRQTWLFVQTREPLRLGFFLRYTAATAMSASTTAQRPRNHWEILSLVMATVAIRIGIRELRQRTSHYPGLIKTGEEVEITDRGALVAELRAPIASKLLRQKMVADGELTPGSSDLRSRRPPLHVPEGTESPSEKLLRMRDAEREDHHR